MLKIVRRYFSEEEALVMKLRNRWGLVSSILIETDDGEIFLERNKMYVSIFEMYVGTPEDICIPLGGPRFQHLLDDLVTELYGCKLPEKV